MRSIVLILCLAVPVSGCGKSQSETAQPRPLTVFEWKAMPVDEKYKPEAIERLKAGDPNLQTPEGWETFQKTVVLPARKKDFPGGKSR